MGNDSWVRRKHLAHDLIDLRLKAHVQHPVGLIQHQVSHTLHANLDFVSCNVLFHKGAVDILSFKSNAFDKSSHGTFLLEKMQKIRFGLLLQTPFTCLRAQIFPMYLALHDSNLI